MKHCTLHTLCPCVLSQPLGEVWSHWSFQQRNNQSWVWTVTGDGRQDKAEPRDSSHKPRWEAPAGVRGSVEKHGGEKRSSSKPCIFISVCNLKVLSYINSLLVRLHEGLLWQAREAYWLSSFGRGNLRAWNWLRSHWSRWRFKVVVLQAACKDAYLLIDWSTEPKSPPSPILPAKNLTICIKAFRLETWCRSGWNGKLQAHKKMLVK